MLMAFVLHRYLDYGPILLVVALLTGIAVLVHEGTRKATAWISSGLFVLASLAMVGPWD